MQDLSLEHAQALAHLAMTKAMQDHGRPICVAVCDERGLLLAFARVPGAPVRGVAIAQGKAYSAARMGTTTAALLERLHREKIEVGYFCDPALTALPGGSPLKNAAGKLLGAIGVSGLTSAEDQAITDGVAATLLAN
ncbi:MAG: heme-binding protein [Aquincola sp.]|nr:heme-binding protein [Aquincola sp.]MDH4289135.1 heme-binding protein [Aquincola sp.]MDH5329749.1 heme-binding protein [Aquincola sp.]